MRDISQKTKKLDAPEKPLQTIAYSVYTFVVCSTLFFLIGLIIMLPGAGRGNDSELVVIAAIFAAGISFSVAKNRAVSALQFYWRWRREQNNTNKTASSRIRK